jgi:hypothetical protein
MPIDPNTARLQLAKDRKCEFAGNGQKIDANPIVRKRLPHLFDDRD